LAGEIKIEDLWSSVEELTKDMKDLQARLAAEPGGQCSAEFPHVDKLVFIRSPGGNSYHCECRKVYMKDGHGGLREVT